MGIGTCGGFQSHGGTPKSSESWTGWWFGTSFFPHMLGIFGNNNHTNWRSHIFLRGRSTTNQNISIYFHWVSQSFYRSRRIFIGFSRDLNHPAIGVPPCMEPPIYASYIPYTSKFWRTIFELKPMVAGMSWGAPIFRTHVWTCEFQLPSGKHTKSYWKWQFIVDLPIKNGDFP